MPIMLKTCLAICMVLMAFHSPIHAQDDALELRVLARTSDFFYAPAASDVEIEIRHLGSGTTLTHGVTDSLGRALLDLGATGETLESLALERLQVLSSWEGVMGSPVVFEIGEDGLPDWVLVSIPAHRELEVLVEGGPAGTSEKDLKHASLSLLALGDTKPIFGFHLLHLQGSSAQLTRIEDSDDGMVRWKGSIGIPHAGDYRLEARSKSRGAASIEMRLDPIALPSQVSLKIEPQPLEGSLEASRPRTWLSLSTPEGAPLPDKTEVILLRDRGDGNLAWPTTVKPEKDAGSARRWELIPGAAYRLAVWGPEVPLFEKGWIQDSEPREEKLLIPTAEIEMGRLGLAESPWMVRHTAYSPRLRIPIAKWFALDRNSDAKPLPPGEYLVVSEGQSMFACNGEILSRRTHFGRSEEWIQVQSGETSFATGKPPWAGSLQVSLTTQQPPDPTLMDLPLYPLPEDLRRTPFHFEGRAICMILHPQDGSAPTALTFTPRRNYGFPLGFLFPGDEETAHEVFPAGVHRLEVRVPGYPRQWIEVEIKERRRTLLSIDLSRP